MPSRSRPSLTIPVERSTLANGLRVVVAPDRSAPVAAVAVFYDVGFRSEPQGRTGFAHLFEHMMFQGTRTQEKGVFDRQILGNGGILNGTTTPDFTNYFEILPSAALELALFLEADRMASLRLDQANLENQIAVVKEEIRLNVLNRPYGKFPWILLAEAMFTTYPNAHDGYGSFDDLEAATLEDVTGFFARYYAPSNAVLVVAGDADPDDAMRLVERHFGGLRSRRAPRIPAFGEPLPTAGKRRAYPDPLAPTPAMAAGYRVPDPVGALDEVLAADVLLQALTDGRSSRLYRRLIRDEGRVTDIDGWIGLGPGWAGPLEMRDPTRLQIQAFYSRRDDLDPILASIDEEVERAAGDLSRDEVDQVIRRMAAGFVRRMDDILARALLLGPLEMQRSDPGLLATIPERLGDIGVDDVRAAAAWLDPSRRTVVEVVPGGGG